MHLSAMPPLINRKVSQVLALLFLAAVTIAVYYRGLFGNFVFDDNPNILLNKWIAIGHLDFESLKYAGLSGEAGLLKRPLAMISFAIDYYFHGYNPFYFKLTNLAIHLLNGYILFNLTKLLSRLLFTKQEQEVSTLFSLLCTAIWLLHPFNLTPVLYVVQRMTGLSSLFVLAGLYVYLAGRIRLSQREKYAWPLIISCYLLFLPLAALSKESGFLLPVYAGLIEYCLTSNFTPDGETKKRILILHTVTLLLPTIAGITLVSLASDRFFDAYDYRNFNLQERLLTESRVIWFYAKQICLPNINEMALYHDDFELSTSLISPVQTLIAIVSLTVTLIIALARLNRISSFSILFFLASHLIESTALPLELVFEHRNYLGSYGLIFGGIYLLFVIKRQRLSKFRLFSTVLMVMFISLLTTERANHWRSNFEMAKFDAKNHPNSARSNAEVAEVLFNFSVNESNTDLRATYFNLARQYFENTANANPKNITGLIRLIHLYGQHNKNIDENIYTKLGERLKQYEIPASIGEIIYVMIECRVNGQCVWDDVKFFNTLVVMLDNPKVKKKRLGTVLNIFSLYQNNVFHDQDKTIYYLNRAIEADPDAHEYLVTLVKYLLAMNRIDEAKIAFTKLQQRDKFGALKSSVSGIEKYLH